MFNVISIFTQKAMSYDQYIAILEAQCTSNFGAKNNVCVFVACL